MNILKNVYAINLKLTNTALDLRDSVINNLVYLNDGNKY